MGSFTVDPSEVGRAGAAVAALAEQAHGALARVRGEAEAVLGGAWQGGAASAFHAAWEQWADGAAAMAAALDDMARLLDRTDQGYAGTEAAVRAELGTGAA